MRAGFVAVPVNYRFPRQTIHFIIEDCGAKLVFCDMPRRDDCPADLPAVVFGQRRRGRLRQLPRSRRVRDRGAAAGRAGDVSLHLRLDRYAEGRRALAPEPHLGGGNAARARARPASLSDRRAALSHECAGAGEARLRGARYHHPAAALRGTRLYRRDLALPPDLAHGGAADDRDDAARARCARHGRPLQRGSRSGWARRRSAQA